MEQKAKIGAGLGPVWVSIGAALRFVRENWRFVLMVAGLGAAAHALALAVVGSTLLWLPAFLIVSAAVHAALTRAALSGAGGVRQAALGDTMRTLAAMVIVGLFAALIALVAAYVAMSALIAPYAEQVKQAGQDEAALRAIFERAVEEQPNALRWAAAIGALLIFALTSRFYFAAPASIDRGKVLAFRSWIDTRTHMLRVMVARFVLLAPALILAGALQSIAGAAIGVNFEDAALVIQRALADPLFWGLMQFLQIAVYSSLEAGLSASLYQTLAARPQPGA